MTSTLLKANTFVSVIMVVKNREHQIQKAITEVSRVLSTTIARHEIIVIDNASEDGSLSVFRCLTGNEGIPNLQIFLLTSEVDVDVAAWAGLENSLGDYAVIYDPFEDDINVISSMLKAANEGADVIFAVNRRAAQRGFAYRLLRDPFLLAFKWATGIHLGTESPSFRMLSRRVVNFVLKHPAPTLSYRHIPATVGFQKVTINYSAEIPWLGRRKLIESVDRGLRILVSSSTLPLRLVTTLSLFGAASNLLYSIYVIAIAIFKANVAPGWITLSLQQSGMFFLISLVLLMIGEYLLQVAQLSSGIPPYHVAQEFTSPVRSWTKNLNIEDNS